MYVINSMSKASVAWTSLMLSSHPSALYVDASGNCSGLRVCSKCDDDLAVNRMPKFAIANGFFCGDIDHPLIDFPENVTEQEWKIMSLVVTRMQVRKIWGVQGGDSSRNGIRGQCCVLTLPQCLRLLELKSFAIAIIFVRPLR